jgi:hypothetical protein
VRHQSLREAQLAGPAKGWKTHTSGLARSLGLGIALWAFFVLAAILAFGLVPRTATGWAVFVFAGPVLAIIGTGLFEGAFHLASRTRLYRGIGRWLEVRTRDHGQVSALRIAILLITALIWVAVIVGLIWGLGALAERWSWLGNRFASMGAFIDRHFWP